MMSSSSKNQPLPLKDLEENLVELLARCRQLREEALRNADTEVLPNRVISNPVSSPPFTA